MVFIFISICVLCLHFTNNSGFAVILGATVTRVPKLISLDFCQIYTYFISLIISATNFVFKTFKENIFSESILSVYPIVYSSSKKLDLMLSKESHSLILEIFDIFRNVILFLDY